MRKTRRSVFALAGDEAKPHDIGRNLVHSNMISREIYALIKCMREQWVY